MIPWRDSPSNPLVYSNFFIRGALSFSIYKELYEMGFPIEVKAARRA